MTDDQLKQIQRLLDVAEGNLHSARNLLLEITGDKSKTTIDAAEQAANLAISQEGKVIEGVFDGEEMVSPDGKKYPVPANYASKSKLVEGDVLKLTIADDGSLIFKQIKPIGRKNLIGVLAYDNGNYSVLAEGKSYKVLFASVTYYKGRPGEKVSIIVPEVADSQWAAIESVIHHGNEEVASPEPVEQQSTPPKEAVSTSATKFELPEENRKALEELRSSILGKSSISEKSPVKEKEEVTIPEPTPPVKEPEKTVSLEEMNRASIEAHKEENSVREGNISDSNTYMSDDSFVKQESEKNALGEELKKPAQDNGIEELEI